MVRVARIWRAREKKQEEVREIARGFSRRGLVGHGQDLGFYSGCSGKILSFFLF